MSDPAAVRRSDDRTQPMPRGGNESQRLKAGDTLGDRFVIVRFLASGGMGDVYEAADRHLQGTHCAVKTLRLDIAGDPALRMRFEREVLLAREVNHPNVCPTYDLFHVTGPRGPLTFLSMKLLRGESLLAYLVRSGRLDVHAVLPLALQMATGLDAAHKAGVIHRDFKPGNVMVEESAQGMRVWITDFGISRALESDATLSDAGHVLGTPGYIAPELLQGRVVSFMADVYAFGVVLHEMVTARKPAYEDGSSTIVPPSAWAPELSPRWDQVILGCLESEPGKRFQSAGEAMGTLDARAGHYRPTRRQAFARHTEKKRTHVPVVAILPLLNLSHGEQDDYLSSGLSDVLITSLGNLRSVRVLSRNATFSYRASDRAPGEVARILDADFAVDGTFQRAGENLRITLCLIAAGSDVVSWSEEVSGTVERVFEVQRRAGHLLARALQVEVDPSEAAIPDFPLTKNVQAFANYAQGRHFTERPDMAGNLDRAVHLFESAIHLDPLFAAAHAALGEAHWIRYSLVKETVWAAKALEHTVEAVRLNPGSPQVRVALAKVYHGLGRSKDAAQELERALDIQPNDDDAHRLLGTIHADKGDFANALSEFGKAIEIRPNSWTNYRALGLASYRAARYPEAIDALTRVIELQPDSDWGYQMLGTVFHATGKTPLALENYSRAIAIAPNASSYTNIGTIHYSEGEYEKALESYRKAAELVPREPLYHRNIGDTYLKLGNRPAAMAAYETAARLTQALLQINPNDHRAIAKLAVYQAKLGAHEKAMELIDDAVRRNENDIEVLYRRAVVLALAGRIEDSSSALRLAIERGYGPAIALDDDDLKPVTAGWGLRATNI